MADEPILHADIALARRLEGAEAASNVAAAEAHARRHPGSGATWLAVAGGHAMFVGVGSPITQAFGVGMNGPVGEDEMDRLEDFFRSRGSGVYLEVCPLADASLLEHLGKRGYRVMEFSNVSVRPLAGYSPAPMEGLGFHVLPARADEEAVYARTAIEGFFGSEALAGMEDLFGGFFEAGKGTAFIAWEDEKPIGAAAMMVHGEIVLCFGDATPGAFRGRGVQSALIAARLAAGVATGCSLGMAVTLPGTISQRNYERHDFRVAFTRAKFARAWQ